jgi:hypothetical protein
MLSEMHVLESQPFMLGCRSGRNLYVLLQSCKLHMFSADVCLMMVQWKLHHLSRHLTVYLAFRGYWGFIVW